MRPRAQTWTGAGMVIALACTVVGIGTSRPARSATVRCGDGIMVDGRLVCGPARRPALAALASQACPGAAWMQQLPTPGTAIAADCTTAPDPALMRDLGVVVDINRASSGALQSLPGIGPVLAARIVAARPFDEAEGLLAVKGIGPATWAKLHSRVQVVAHLEPQTSPDLGH